MDRDKTPESRLSRHELSEFWRILSAEKSALVKYTI